MTVYKDSKVSCWIIRAISNTCIICINYKFSQWDFKDIALYPFNSVIMGKLNCPSHFANVESWWLMQIIAPAERYFTFVPIALSLYLIHDLRHWKFKFFCIQAWLTSPPFPFFNDLVQKVGKQEHRYAKCLTKKKSKTSSTALQSHTIPVDI